ncbi:T9SS type A sorting domain-containing protein [Adhaeribacter radiodurans]|uniref:T9SS type A sorting domain-containing protein n=1 Tax=Adhaeribacter radiodurans TaxID=2745197 RepID=A0A7L7L5P7_9BACT|nr:T9SS type A sorting domain-containing protein [Adhaeribacter radiodurans]QMU28141.1 T9SS type A sorting domain-containing protein [Adhaeribacter radiodurans]
MKNYFILVLLLWWSRPGFSQPAWRATTPFSKVDYTTTNSLAVSPTSGHLYVSLEEEGLQCSTDNGNIWKTILDKPVYTVSIRSDGTIFAGGSGHIFTSADEGQSWASYSFPSTTPISSLVFNIQGHLFAGTSNIAESSSPGAYGEGVFTSTNNGQTWQSLNNGLINLNIINLAIDASDKLYLGTNEDQDGQAGGVYSWAPGATTWTRLPLDIEDLYDVKASYVHMIGLNRQGHLFVSFEGTSGRAVVQRTITSKDGGGNWQVVALRQSPFNPYFDNVYLQSFYLSSSGRLWSSIPRKLGIYFSDDHGATWVQHMSGMNSSYNIVDFAQDATGSLYALLRYDSNVIYSLQKPLAIVDPLVPVQLQTYPNPFRDKLHLVYTVPTTGPVYISVTDALGKIIFTEKQQLVAGTHRFMWQAANTTSGLYVVQVQTERQILVKKVIRSR